MLSKDYRVPREIDERDLVFDARPKTAVEAAEQAIQDMKEMPEPLDDPFEYLTPGLGDFRKIAKRSPVDRIAEMMRVLTYGEMVHLAANIWAVAEGEITEKNLPQVLWDWAVSP